MAIFIRPDQSTVSTAVRWCVLTCHKSPDVLSGSAVRAVTADQNKKELETDDGTKSKMRLRATECEGTGGRTVFNRWRGWFCWWLPREEKSNSLLQKMCNYWWALSALPSGLGFWFKSAPIGMKSGVFYWCASPLLQHKHVSEVWFDMETHLSPFVF